MKIFYSILAGTFFLLASVTAQIVVSEDVHFDYYQTSVDNDFVNHFSYGPGLSQLQTNGITGGSLLTPDSINWGTDNAVYCSRFRPVSGDTITVGMCFKYDSTVVQPGSFQRALSVWLMPGSDFNHYVVATVSRNKKMELLTYSWNNNPYPDVSLFHNHWYRYVLSAVFIGGVSHQVSVHGEVFDLGLNGLASPVSVNASGGIINDSVLVADTAIQVSVTGTSYGGVIYLDDFYVRGREGYSDCINVVTMVNEESFLAGFSVYPAIVRTIFFVEKNSPAEEIISISIYDLQGIKKKELMTNKRKTELNVSSLSSGIYFIQCCTTTGLWSTKIMVTK